MQRFDCAADARISVRMRFLDKEERGLWQPADVVAVTPRL